MKVALCLLNTVTKKETVLKIVEGDAFIGSGPEVDIRLENWQCSGVHALITKVTKAGFTLVDLGSQYGTRVQGKNIKEEKLSLEEEFSIGSDTLVLRPIEQAVSILNLTTLPARRHLRKSETLKGNLETLAVSLLWGDQLIDKKIFREGESITLGHSRSSSFSIDFDTSAKKMADFKVAEYKKGKVTLYLKDEFNGLIWEGNKIHSIDKLRLDKTENAKLSEVSIRLGDRAKIEFGELSLNFEFSEKIKPITGFVFPKIDRKSIKYTLTTLLLYLIFFSVLIFSPQKMEEKKLKDIPLKLKKIVYDIGIKNADQKRIAAIGELTTDEGGRAKSEEGKMKTKKEKKSSKVKEQKIVQKVTEKPPVPEKKEEVTAKNVVEEKKVNMDKFFDSPTNTTASVADVAMESNLSERGNSVAALADGNFAYGRTGEFAGGGGKSRGIGSLSGQGSGGAMGGHDSGLKVSKGKEIKIADEEEITIQGGLDPEVIARIIKRYLPQIQHCYELGLTQSPNIRGKVTVGFNIIASGNVGKPQIAETSLNHSFTEKCIITKVTKWVFPKPRGGGTVGVKYPFILMSNTSN